MSAAGLVVVGSGPGGLAAARAFRKADSDTPVTMVTADPYPPYNRPPLTKDYNDDQAYERGQKLLERNATFAEAAG